MECILKKHGLKVFLTRRSDIYENVNQKAIKANKSKSDLFISIHCNSAISMAAKGTECLIYSFDGVSDKLSNNIQKHVVKALNTSDRGVKVRKDLAVLNGTNIPAVLVEMAFISNTEDRDKLNYRQKEFAKAISDGILEYLGVDEMVEKSKIIIDGKELEVERILKNGTNYIKIRDIASTLRYNIRNKNDIPVLNKK